MSVFRSEANAVVEITQTVEPAFFRQGDAEREIQRLSRDFAQQARVIGAELPWGGHAVIAAWGAVSLIPLDPQVVDALRRGVPVHSGLLVGALADPRAAARLGLPVYSLGGGAGFIWGADYNSSGKGVLRIIAVDPSALKSATRSQPVASAPSSVITAYAAPEPPGTPAPFLDDGGRRDHGEKVPVAASAGSAGSADSSASSSSLAGPTQEAKIEPPSAPLPSSPAPSSAPSNRVALIVANGAYPEAPLANPTVDADVVADTLKKIGFSVTVQKNLDLDRFEQAITDFAESTRGADIALFYFAGHGFSVDLRGRQENLLMATSANFSAKTALALEGGGEPLDHVEETIIGRPSDPDIYRRLPQHSGARQPQRRIARLRACGYIESRGRVCRSVNSRRTDRRRRREGAGQSICASVCLRDADAGVAHRGCLFSDAGTGAEGHRGGTGSRQYP